VKTPASWREQIGTMSALVASLMGKRGHISAEVTDVGSDNQVTVAVLKLSAKEISNSPQLTRLSTSAQGSPFNRTGNEQGASEGSSKAVPRPPAMESAGESWSRDAPLPPGDPPPGGPSSPYKQRISALLLEAGQVSAPLASALSHTCDA
jgi:hypothetical protein